MMCIISVETVVTNKTKLEQLREDVRKRKEENKAWKDAWHPCGVCGTETTQEYCEYCTASQRRIQQGAPNNLGKVIGGSLADRFNIIDETLRNIQKRLDEIERRLAIVCECGQPCIEGDYLCVKCRKDLEP